MKKWGGGGKIKSKRKMPGQRKGKRKEEWKKRKGKLEQEMKKEKGNEKGKGKM